MKAPETQEPTPLVVASVAVLMGAGTVWTDQAHPFRLERVGSSDRNVQIRWA